MEERSSENSQRSNESAFLMTSGIETSSAVEGATGAGFGVAQQITAFTEVLLLGVWIGSMIFFSFAVAPSAFAVLPTRELAGAMVTSTIGKIEVLGLVIGALLILIQAASWRSRHSSKLNKSLKVILIVVMSAAAALSRFWISPEMVSLRAGMGGHIDDVPLGDPLRMQFNDLHQYSVALMSTAMIAGLVALFLTVRSWLKR
jgi:putative copper export protein